MSSTGIASAAFTIAMSTPSRYGMVREYAVHCLAHILVGAKAYDRFPHSSSHSPSTLVIWRTLEAPSISTAKITTVHRHTS